MEVCKFMFYPVWKAEKLEEKLSKLESEGLRLKKEKLFSRYVFERAKRKDCTYVVTYSMTNDNHPGLYEWERILLSEYKANEIKNKHFSYRYFRITGEAPDLTDFKKDRDEYLRHVMLHRLLTALFCTLIITIPFLRGLIFEQEATVFGNVVGFVLLAISFSLFMYDLYGYIAMKSKCRKYVLKQ